MLENSVQLIRSSFGIGTAFWYNRNPPFESTVPHTFIVVGGLKDGRYLCVHGTSKVGYHRSQILSDHHANAKVDETYVVVAVGVSALFDRETLIDGNKLWALRAEDIAAGIKGMRDCSAEPAILNAIVAAVNKSKEHSPAIKKCVRAF